MVHRNRGITIAAVILQAVGEWFVENKLHSESWTGEDSQWGEKKITERQSET